MITHYNAFVTGKLMSLKMTKMQILLVYMYGIFQLVIIHKSEKEYLLILQVLQISFTQKY